MADITTARGILCEIEPHLIFHFSGLATASPDRELVLPTLHSLLVSTANVLTVAAEIRSRRLVLAASLTEPQPGSAEITPGSPYAAAKWASGAYARMFHKLYDLPVVMVRPFMTYGPAQDEHKLIPHVIISLLRGEAPKLSSGQQRIDWIYIDDVMDGFLKAAVAPSIEGETIDLGSGVLTSIRAVVEKITAISGSQLDPQFGALADRPLERERVADVPKARHKLGWNPKVSLDQGLEQTVAWYEAKLSQSREGQVQSTCI